MFVLCAVLLFLSAAIFYYFGSGRTQEWNKPGSKAQDTKNTSEMANF